MPLRQKLLSDKLQYTQAEYQPVSIELASARGFTLARYGLGAAGVIKYYLATHLRPFISWSTQHLPSCWIEIEAVQLYPTQICTLIWSRTSNQYVLYKRL